MVRGEEMRAVTRMVDSRYMDYNAYRNRYPMNTVSRKSNGCRVSTSTYMSYKTYRTTYPANTVSRTWFVDTG